jgi:diadenosine tetraphosphate (Ap4A) HIT family hydrolase
VKENNFELHPRLKADSYGLGDLPLSRLLLINDTQFPWFVLVPRRDNIKEIYQLAEKDQIQLWQESSSLSQTIMALFQGDKLNVAAIGNLVPQLHLHHVVRFKNDLCWPAPIWGKLPMVAYEVGIVSDLQQKIAEKMADLRLSAI